MGDDGESQSGLLVLAIVSLTAPETTVLGGMDRALASIREKFSDTDAVQEKLAEAAGDDWEDVFSGAVVDVDGIVDLNSEDANAGADNTVKGILFLTFVVCLTLFVVVVLAIVVWLEYKKCRVREPYASVDG